MREISPGSSSDAVLSGESHQTGSWLGVFVAALVLLAVMGGLLVATRSQSLLARPFWLDEFHTLLVAGDPSLSHSLSALRHGADFNPPGMYLLLRVYQWITGPLGETSLRVFALGSVYVGLLGVYVLLSRCFRGPVALAGTLATWAHPLLMHLSFDGRFYGLWFALAVWICVALNRLETTRHPRRMVAVVGVLSALLCSLHYFGVFSLTLLAVAHLAFASHRRGWACLGLLFGPLTLVGLVPLFYVGQRAAISVPTWIDPPDLNQTRNMLTALFPGAVFAVPAVVATLAILIPRLRPGVSRVSFEESTLRSLAGALGLSLMPVAILAISYLIQPSMVNRYAIVAVACVGPIVATILERSRLVVTLVACLALVAMGAITFRDEVRFHRYAQSADVIRAVDVLRAEDPAQGLIVSESRGLIYQCWRYGPDLRNRLRMVDLSADYQGNKFNYHRLERDVAVRLSRWYDVPAVVTLAEVAKPEPLYLIATKEDADGLAARFPGYRRQDLHDDLVIVMKLTPIP